jgi:hypothetical protein
MTDTTTVNTETANAGFGIQDLVFTLQVFEACSQRGAFRADEFSNVGAVYDRLKAFLIANGAVSNPATADTATTTTGEE